VSASARPECLVFLLGEGPNDIGDLAKPSFRREGREGFFQPLLRRLSSGRASLRFDGSVLKALGLERRKPREAWARKVAAGAALARTKGAQALGDLEALRAHTGRSTFGAEVLRVKPEELWGDDQDPTSNFPKHALTRALGGGYDTEDLRALAELIDPATLRRTCPESFPDFEDAVHDALTACEV